jgi:hypothetical protein
MSTDQKPVAYLHELQWQNHPRGTMRMVTLSSETPWPVTSLADPRPIHTCTPLVALDMRKQQETRI